VTNSIEKLIDKTEMDRKTILYQLMHLAEIDRKTNSRKKDEKKKIICYISINSDYETDKLIAAKKS